MSKYSLDSYVYNWKKGKFEQAPRGPFAGYVGQLILGQFGIMASTTSFLAIAVGTVGILAVTAIVGALLKPKKPKEPGREFLTNIKDPAAPREIVYGKVRKGGIITHLESTDGGRYLHMFIALADHEIEAVDGIYIDDEEQTDNWTRSTGLISGDTNTDKNWSGKVRAYIHKGAQTTSTDTFESSTSSLSSTYHTEKELGQIDQNFIGRGIAYAYVRLEYDRDVFEEGIPTFTFVVKGKKVLNASGTALTYPASANAAWVIRDYLTSEYGVNEADANIDVSGSFTTAATVCDTNSGDGLANKFEVNGVLSTGTGRIDNLESLVNTCGGTLFWGSGHWKLKAASFTSSVKTLNLDDLRGSINIDTKHSLRDQFNAVSGTFNDADQDYIEVDYPQIASSTYLTEDNEEKSVADFSLPMVTNSVQAQRLAKLMLNRHREQLTWSAVFGLNAFDVEVGDTIKFNDYNSATGEYRYGWGTQNSNTGKEFEVIGWSMAVSGEDQDIGVKLTMRETSSTAFDWDAEEQTIVSNNTDLGNYQSNLTPSSVTATDVVKVQSDGTTITTANVTWSAPSAYQINHYEVQWKLTSESTYQTATTQNVTSFNLGPVTVGQSYNVRVRAFTVAGNAGAFANLSTSNGVSSSTHTVTGDTTAPAAPSGASATGGIKSVVLDWTAPSDADLAGYKIYRSTSNSQPANPIGKVLADRFTDSGLSDSTTYYYWVEAFDHSGNDSSALAFSAVTTLAAPVDGADGAPGADGADGDTVVTGKVYYTTLQASAPSTPSATSYSVSTASFTGLSSGWSLTQPQIEITDTSVSEWSSDFTVTISGVDSSQTLVFTTPSGAVQVATDLESDNYSAGSAGWKLERDTGNIEVNEGTFRGDVLVGNLAVNSTTMKPTSGTGARIEADGDLAFGGTETFVRFDQSEGELEIRGDLINFKDAFFNGNQGTWGQVNTSTNTLGSLLDGAGIYVFFLVGAGGTGGSGRAREYNIGSAGGGGGGGGCAAIGYEWDGNTALGVTFGSVVATGSYNDTGYNTRSGTTTLSIDSSTRISITGGARGAGGGANNNSSALGGVGGGATINTQNDFIRPKTAQGGQGGTGVGSAGLTRGAAGGGGVDAGFTVLASGSNANAPNGGNGGASGNDAGGLGGCIYGPAGTAGSAQNVISGGLPFWGQAQANLEHLGNSTLGNTTVTAGFFAGGKGGTAYRTPASQVGGFFGGGGAGCVPEAASSDNGDFNRVGELGQQGVLLWYKL